MFELRQNQAAAAAFIDDVSVELAGQQLLIADCTHQAE